jgi:hypothetical protein
MRRAALLTTAMWLACSNGNKTGTDSASLQEALSTVRETQEQLCVTLDGCYPDQIEAGWCNYPAGDGSGGFERDWPPPASDVCWRPLFEHDAEAVLDYFTCLNAADREMAECIGSCPDDATQCARASNVAGDDCAEEFLGELPPSLLATIDDCEDEHAPEEED